MKVTRMDDYSIIHVNKDFLISNDDLELVKQYSWNVCPRGYVRTTVDGKFIYLHRLLMNYPEEDVDHINRNKSDNRRFNLRVVNRSLNTYNKDLMVTNKSGKTGVYYDKDRCKWVAQITKDGVVYSLGRFVKKEDAIKVRRKKELELYGEYSPCSI